MPPPKTAQQIQRDIEALKRMNAALFREISKNPTWNQKDLKGWKDIELRICRILNDVCGVLDNKLDKQNR